MHEDLCGKTVIVIAGKGKQHLSVFFARIIIYTAVAHKTPTLRIIILLWSINVACMFMYTVSQKRH